MCMFVCVRVFACVRQRNGRPYPAVLGVEGLVLALGGTAGTSVSGTDSVGCDRRRRNRLTAAPEPDSSCCCCRTTYTGHSTYKQRHNTHITGLAVSSRAKAVRYTSRPTHTWSISRWCSSSPRMLACERATPLDCGRIRRDEWAREDDGIC